LTTGLAIHMIRPMDSRTIVRKLRDAGWVHFRTTGSHHHLTHQDTEQVVTVPHPRKDVPIGTIKSTERQSGVKLRRK
jgi:predicted RNA binding protein YcfA (HicA-like mRNA interferase family)